VYKEDNNQISIIEFISPFGILDQENRWVKITNMIPWSKYEEKYKKNFCTDNGAPAIKFRMAMGTLLIKQQTGRSDDDVLNDILESPYKQFLIGLNEFTTTPPFSASSITNFRKYITTEMINEINNELFRKNNDNSGNHPDAGGDGNPNDQTETQVKIKDEYNATQESVSPERIDHTEPKDNQQTPLTDAPKEGTLIMDASCAPADIAYPTDINLLNEAREKLEGIIDTLYPFSPIFSRKPRTYREIARDEYLGFVLLKKPGYVKLREVIEQQLKYVNRDLKHADKLLETVSIDKLSALQQQWLGTIRLLYEQQLYMFENNTKSVANRIVSIGQPFVRPIKRGKANANYEFGAKISISLVDGYSFIDMLSWDSYNEEAQLIPAVEAYKKHYGFYPERVLADQIYRNKNNRVYCKERGIRLTGPRLGRPSATEDKALKRQQAQDSADRNAVEGKFGEGKHKYGLNRIMARIKESCETVISLAFLSMNINKRLRVSLSFFRFIFKNHQNTHYNCCFYHFLPVHNFSFSMQFS
jgi:hypothetical protein